MHKFLSRESRQCSNTEQSSIQNNTAQPTDDKKDMKVLKFLNLLSKSPTIKLSQRLKKKQQALQSLHSNDNAVDLTNSSSDSLKHFKSSQSSQSSQSPCGSPKKSLKRKPEYKEEESNKKWKITLNSKPECKQFPKAQSVPPHIAFLEQNANNLRC